MFLLPENFFFPLKYDYFWFRVMLSREKLSSTLKNQQANVFFSKDDEKQNAKWNFQRIFRKLQPFRYLYDHLHMTVDNRHYDAYFK